MARSRPPSGWTGSTIRLGHFGDPRSPCLGEIQHEVERQAQALIDSTLKPRYLQPPPKQAELNYLVNIYTRWRGPFLYFLLPILLAWTARPFTLLQSKFARLQYAGDGRFNLAYFRHTGQSWEIAQLLSLEECLSEIEAGGLFTP